jgi:hypothetical protein
MVLAAYGLLALVAVASLVIEWNWRRRIDRTRRKADYPVADRYPPLQASAMQKWPWV